MNVPVKAHQELEDERINFIHLILEALGEGWEPGGHLLPLRASPRAPFFWALGPSLTPYSSPGSGWASPFLCWASVSPSR